MAAVMLTAERKICTVISFQINKVLLLPKEIIAESTELSHPKITVQNIVNKFMVHGTVLNRWKGNLGRNKTLLGGPRTCHLRYVHFAGQRLSSAKLMSLENRHMRNN